MLHKLLLVLFIILAGTGMLFSQTVMLEPYGVSPAQIKADTVGNENYIGILDRVYSGLLNVGVETKMVLKGSSDTTLISPMWEVMEAPSGAMAAVMNVTVVDTATELATFTPDLIGKYVVKFTSNGVEATVTINAGTYVGVYSAPGCVCHSEHVALWEGTDHSTMFDRALDGAASSHYSESCVSCHTTGFDDMAANGGFDDFNFVFPTELIPGMADSMYATYPDAMLRANIQCESCHGPASAHMGATADAKMVSSLDAAVCAACHDDDHYHVYPSQWETAGHAEIPSYPGGNRTDCQGCHNGAQFIQFVEGETITRQPHIDITCAVCHDPHNSFGDTPEADNGRFQMRTVSATLANGEMVAGAGNGALCMNCHQSRRDAVTYTNAPGSHYGPHYAPQADMLIGTNAVTFGKTLPTSPHLAATDDACVDCHMYEKGSHGEHDEDGDLNTSGMHSFSMVSKKGVDNVSACVDCHGDVGSTFEDKKYFMNGDADHDGDGQVEGLQGEVHGLMDKLGALLPDADPHADVDETWTVTELKAAFNHRLVYYDHSYGIHNPAYIVSLLKVSIQALENNALEGEIVAISDVPNDQGKMVKIIWDKFVDDGIATDPVEKYIVKRHDAYDDTWTTVGEVTADGSARYALVVPTVFDSTAEGNGLTSFMVSALTEGGMVHESMAAQGYSIDNLVPMAPQNLLAVQTGKDVDLAWDEAVDPDVNYYRVFRADVEGFEPSEATEIGTTATVEFRDNSVVAGSHFYKIVAVDFSGNESEASAEVNVNVTGLEDLSVPSEFKLSQNYPNPFNPGTRIEVAVRDAGHVSLQVYNALGQKVASLLDKEMTAGVYTINFNGSGFSSGVYFYKILVTNGSGVQFESMRKMILMK